MTLRDTKNCAVWRNEAIYILGFGHHKAHNEIRI